MDYITAYKELVSLTKSWKDIDQNNIQPELSQLSDFVDKLIRLNWRRADVYNLFVDILKVEELSNGQTTVLWDCETAITGYCDPAYILRFPDEKITSNEELAHYVRSEVWKN